MQQQLSLDLALPLTVKVGCRVEGEIQHYLIDCHTVHEARKAVLLGVHGSRPVLAVIQGGKVDKPVAAFSHTTAPGPSAA